MDYQTIDVRTEAERVGVITLNRPKQLNALNDQLMDELGAALAAFDADEAIGCIVVTGSERAFAAGADIGAMARYTFADVYKGDYIGRNWERIRSVRKPVVAAVAGFALGGGCELAVHAARRVAAMESYMGLVEVGVGLVPGAGGLTYIARRAAEQQATSTLKDLLPFLSEGFTAAASAKVGTSAIDSKKLGWLVEGDIVLPNAHELLWVALHEALALQRAGWRPTLRRAFPVAGRSGIATIRGQLVNLRDGGFISAHDQHIGGLIAEGVCGGDIDAGTLVTEETLMALERKAFCSLIEHPRTQERILGMMNTGKPLRN